MPNFCADTLLSKDEWRQSFNVYENTITALYEACKPALFQYLRGVIDSVIQQQDIDAARNQKNKRATR